MSFLRSKSVTPPHDGGDRDKTVPDAHPAGGSARRSPAEAVHSPALIAFKSAIGPLLLNEPAPFAFEGAVRAEHAEAFWRWLTRDALPDLEDRFETAVASGETDPLSAFIPEIASAVHRAFDAVAGHGTAAHRLTVQMGGEEVRAAVPPLLIALKSQRLIDRATALGRATNGLTDAAALGLALKSVPRAESSQAGLLMLAMVFAASHPGRLMSAAVTLAGDTGQDAVVAAGYAPLVEAMLAHAQNQLSVFSQDYGVFSDIDLVCRSLDRFHRLVHAVTSYVGLERGGRWARIAASLTTSVSESLERPLRNVSGDLVQSLRRRREGNDRLDSDLLLSALNGMYLLAAARDARDSLALNAMLERVWKETGQSLEMLIDRNLDLVRADPYDTNAATRLEYAIKMARLRFGNEYADALERARKAVHRRIEAS